VTRQSSHLLVDSSHIPGDMKSWIQDMIPEGSDFTLDNLPWGVFRNESSRDSICVAIGDHVMDVKSWSMSLRESTEYDWSLEVEDALQQVPCECANVTRERCARCAR
jgi:hypothetical protein